MQRGTPQITMHSNPIQSVACIELIELAVTLLEQHGASATVKHARFAVEQVTAC